jgi:hypothetical protein
VRAWLGAQTNRRLDKGNQEVKAPTFIKPVVGAKMDASEMRYILGRLNEIRVIAYAARFERAPNAIIEILKVVGDALAVAEGRSRE